jgi:L-arabinose isomerase
VLKEIIDMGNRFCLIVNEVDVITPEHDLPKLPVARAVWLPKPSLKVAAAAWIYAAERTTPASARRLPWSTWRTSLKLPASN